jgi:hypothetical protein
MSKLQPPTKLSKFRAIYYAGLTIEADPHSFPPTLKIDGNPITIEKDDESWFSCKDLPGFKSGELMELAVRVIDILWNSEDRKTTRSKHIEQLHKGRDSWNTWRRQHPEVRPLLFEASLRGEDLCNFNFCNANLINADLTDATLIGANFHEANLGGAQLNGTVKLMGANFCRTDLYETELIGANLAGANLQGTQLARTNFRGADLTGCTIYGLSAWNLKLDDDTKQNDLRIYYPIEQDNKQWDEGTFVVSDLQVAQFIFLLLDNKRFNNFFNEMTSRAVVIMGRFSPESRKEIIDGLRQELRRCKYLPIVFDFPRGEDRDFTETIKTLVGLCKFAIVDLTSPRSSPLELEATVKDYQVPFFPIIQKGEKPFSMFADFRKYNWMLWPPFEYRSRDDLIAGTESIIIKRALKAHEEIRNVKARQEIQALSYEEYKKYLAGC